MQVETTVNAIQPRSRYIDDDRSYAIVKEFALEMMTVSRQSHDGHAAVAPLAFAALLRRDREEAGMSLELLAAKMESSMSYLFRLEKGVAANPGRNFTIRLGIMLYRDDIDRLDQLLKAAGHLPLMPARGPTSAA